MPVAVVKVGSSLVAQDVGRAAAVRRRAHLRGGRRAAPRRRSTSSSSPPARSRAGCGCSTCRSARAAIDALQAASAIGQGRLYRTYDELLRERDIKTAQVLLTFFDMSARTHYLNARRTLRKLLEWRIVPVINENDTTTTDEISFGDNDFLAAQVAVLLNAELLVLLTDTEGLYTADPRRDPAARLVEEVTDYEALARPADRARRVAARARAGCARRSWPPRWRPPPGVTTGDHATASRPGACAAPGPGERVGTRFPPQPVRHSSFKLWLKYAKPSHGTVTVDAGAARALREGGTSLLPVGVVEVQGGFDAGDAVDIHGAGAGPVGKGISNYSADELRRVKGLKSAQVREVLPRATDEAVHRDYFVLA